MHTMHIGGNKDRTGTCALGTRNGVYCIHTTPELRDWAAGPWSVSESELKNGLNASI